MRCNFHFPTRSSHFLGMWSFLSWLLRFNAAHRWWFLLDTYDCISCYSNWRKYHSFICEHRCSFFFQWSLASWHPLSALLLQSQIISINPAFICHNNRLPPLITFHTNTFRPVFTHFKANGHGIQYAHTRETCKWSCKIACTLSNEIKYLHELSSGEVRIGGNQWASCGDQFFIKCSNWHTSTSFHFTALPTILKFGLPLQMCGFLNTKCNVLGTPYKKTNELWRLNFYYFISKRQHSYTTMT